MSKQHHYTTHISWEGSTRSYTAYSRNHIISIDNKPPIPASSDPHFRGDDTRYNPEELLVASLSSCHMLWYLHLCADNGIIVTNYTDNAQGTLTEDNTKGGYFTQVILHPIVTITDASKLELANALHDKAHTMCYIANSCNFPVTHVSECVVSI